ncbi:hypothetical protein ON05_005595 [Acaryochloris sp. CCMEE 5410]|nr:hypothetical protein ON05_005595 [Acaryochloris sp. CCMEE 5410]
MGSSDQGVRFLGPHRGQRQVFVLSISHADSIMGALHDRYRHLLVVKWVAVIQDWADMAGWWESEGDCAIAPHDTERLIEGLASLRAEVFAGDYPLASDLMDSVHGLYSFLHQHWIKGEIVYIENL